MSIFKYSDYRTYLRDLFANSPKRGRGKLLELAGRLRVHPTVVSQVFSGRREFSEEQAIEICEWLELVQIEEKHFRLLVRIANASTVKLKKSLKVELEAIRNESRSIATRVQSDRTLSDAERATFYSSWLYSACRLYCSTRPNGCSIDEIASRFHISRAKTLTIMDFLSRTGLTVSENDRYQMGSQSTFVDKHSPFLGKHFSNWRIKAIQASESISDDELMFSGPFSSSASDFIAFRERLVELIKEFTKVVKDSPSEEIGCLNIDFFRIKN